MSLNNIKTKIKTRHLLLATILAIIFFLIIWLFFGPTPAPHKTAWGINFSQPQAEYLGLDWKQAYQATLTDLKAKRYRLSAYWNRIEPQKDDFQFDELDYLLTEANRNKANVVLAIGGKLPRWPECHYPDWAKNLDQFQLENRILAMLTHVVNHAKMFPNIVAWQVENEPFLDFGLCPKAQISKDFLGKEILLVRSLDPRPIIVTESGELSTWLGAARRADVVGISLYRTVWTRFIGALVYPLTPSFYNRHADFVRHWAKDVIITELQAEPWGDKPIKEQTLQEQRQSFDLTRFNKNIEFVRQTNISTALIWGAEYWYFLKQAGQSNLWDRARILLSE